MALFQKKPTFVIRFTEAEMDIKPKTFLNEYETTFIVTPELSSSEHQEKVDKFVNFIKENGGRIHNIEHWGVRKLAYPIKKRTNGYYAYIEFNADADFIPKLEQNYRYDETIIRYLTVKLDKFALEFNEKRRAQGFGMRKELKKNK